ncbi:MAG TPA: O-antigen ligase family protein [Terracidiphilus sp.]|nr:O-antigen ligase family protein [Terracidiphilus sp.]
MKLLKTGRVSFFRRLRSAYLPLALWACLWSNLNTGYWNFNHPGSISDWLLFLRAALPFIALPAAILVLQRRRKFGLPQNAPSRLLLVYGLFSALAAFFAPAPLPSLYWATAFVATIFVAWSVIDRRDPVRSVRELLIVTWIAAFIVAAIIAHQASGAIFGEYATGYGVVLKETEGLSRSSGVARWAAVPGLVCLVRAYHTRRKALMAAYLGLSGVAFFIVYRMQSRGAVFGAAAALAFALLTSSRMRRYALPFAIAAVATILLVDSPATVSQNVTEYLERGQSKQEFMSMTGRTRAYDKGIQAIKESPLFGYGQWADREVIHEHVHNTYLAALMDAGLIGGIPYLISWITGWMLYFKLQGKSHWLDPEDRIHLLEAGTVMMFFTVRAIPETTTAEYGVDLLVMIAVYVYLEVLTSCLQMQRQRRTATSVAKHGLELVAAR